MGKIEMGDKSIFTEGADTRIENFLSKAGWPTHLARLNVYM